MTRLRRPSIARHISLASLLLVAVACESPMAPSATRSATGAAQLGKSTTQQATWIDISAANVSAGQSVTVDALLYSGHVVGAKRLSLSVDGGAPSSTSTGKAGATWTVSGLSAGTHSLLVSFDGDNTWGPSSATATVTVNP